jgi:hypothetical protein
VLWCVVGEQREAMTTLCLLNQRPDLMTVSIEITSALTAGLIAEGEECGTAAAVACDVGSKVAVTSPPPPAGLH